MHDRRECCFVMHLYINGLGGLSWLGWLGWLVGLGGLVGLETDYLKSIRESCCILATGTLL